MSENKQLDEELNQEETKEIENTEKQKPVIPVQKISKAPNFAHQNQFARGWFNNMNQKQRPWRAASRWR